MHLARMRMVLRGLLGCGLLAGLASENKALEPEPGRPWKTSLSVDVSLDLVWIPPGTFTMGSPASELGRHDDEGPQTNVTLTKGFWLGKTCVTVGQWKAIMGIGVRAQLVKQINDETLHDIGGKNQRLRELMNWSPAADPATYLGNEDDNLPMYFVSWNDAMEFCAKLNARERTAGRLPAGYEYDLPTEAQWEYACRAGSTGATYAGPNIAEMLDGIAWYEQNSGENYTGRPLGPTRSGPRSVGHKTPNAWGLYDMYGNIWQWCRDWHGSYPGGSVTDPIGPVTGTLRVNRGGSFGSGASSERSACRAGNPEYEASAYRGFRIALCPLSSK